MNEMELEENEVGSGNVSHVGFNNNDAARCRNKICLNGGGSPQKTVGKM